MNRLLLILAASSLLVVVSGCEPGPDVEGDEAGECSDGVDNDQDGPTDCDDDGCATATACVGAADDDDSAADDDDAVDDDDTSDACAAAVPCSGNRVIENSLELDEIALCSSISGYVYISGQAWLTSIDLPCLTAVGESLTIRENPALTNLDGLSSLASVEAALAIRENPALTNLDGLSSLTSVLVSVAIWGNPALCQSLVDAFIAAGVGCGPIPGGGIEGNDDGC